MMMLIMMMMMMTMLMMMMTMLVMMITMMMMMRVTLPFPHGTDLLWLACEAIRVTTEHQFVNCWHGDDDDDKSDARKSNGFTIEFTLVAFYLHSHQHCKACLFTTCSSQWPRPQGGPGLMH